MWIVTDYISSLALLVFIFPSWNKRKKVIATFYLTIKFGLFPLRISQFRLYNSQIWGKKDWIVRYNFVTVSYKVRIARYKITILPFSPQNCKIKSRNNGLGLLLNFHICLLQWVSGFRAHTVYFSKVLVVNSEHLMCWHALLLWILLKNYGINMYSLHWNDWQSVLSKALGYINKGDLTALFVCKWAFGSREMNTFTGEFTGKIHTRLTGRIEFGEESDRKTLFGLLLSAPLL